jgi:hypothetical protein
MVAPTIANGMTSQFAQPRRGRKAIATKIAATIPMISETTLSMDGPSLCQRDPISVREIPKPFGR